MKQEIFAKDHGDYCTITVEASPEAARTKIIGVNTWRKALQVKVAAEARDGRANAELVRFLAARLSVPPSSVRLLKGEKSSIKVLRLPLKAERACDLLRSDD